MPPGDRQPCTNSSTDSWLLNLYGIKPTDIIADAPARPPPMGPVPFVGPVPLGPTEWLHDKHITADYALLFTQLSIHNPGLSHETRFVAPAAVHLLAAPERAVPEFLRVIGCDPDGQNSVRFLFLPVSKCDATFGGTHWSLLFVDLGHSHEPVAYHYDPLVETAQRVIAMQLAAQLGARFEEAPMAQQSNGYDCGVAVLTATWALARRLASGPPPEVMLDLGELIVDRLLLQVRLGQAQTVERIAADWLSSGLDAL